LLQHPSRSPSSLYFVQLMNGDIVTIGALATNAPVIPLPTPLAYDESDLQPRTNGLFLTLPVAGDSLLPRDWTNVHAFAGLVPGLRWACGVPYQQRLHAATNLTAISAPGAYAVLTAYSPPEDQTLSLAPKLMLEDGTLLPLSGQRVQAWRGWPMIYNRMVLLDYAVVPTGHSLAQVDPAGTQVMGLTAFLGDPSTWQPYQQSLSNAAAAFLAQEQQRQLLLELQAGFSQLPANKIALLPLDTSGAPATFAAITGLNRKWQALTETQLVDGVTFTAARYPLAFYLGSENYVKTVITNGDGKAAVTRYLAGGGTLVVLASGPFPFYNGYGPNDQPGPADPLLPVLGLPIYNAFEQAPANLSLVISTNQSILHSVPAVFPFPPGDPRLRPVKRSQVSSAHRYVPWLTVTNFAGQGYGDAACFIEFGSGSAKGGKVIYIWSSLLSGPQGQALMANAVGWIVDAVLRPPSARFNSISHQRSSWVTLGFDALPNLDYTLQYRSDLGTGSWLLSQDFGSAPVGRSLSVTSTISGSSRYYRLGIRP
ncbi:MAG TPA: hypothetical protein VNZ22_07525, partial [Bacillota bacterium]|nr:hypothetical protein [Bacillota bacterium]